MTRYQVYLNPKSVAVLDSVARQLDLSRSTIIRDVVDRVSHEFGKLLAGATVARRKSNPLLKMAGIIKVPLPQGRSLAENVDEIYLHD